MPIIKSLKEVLKLMGLLKDPVIHSYCARKEKRNIFYEGSKKGCGRIYLQYCD